MRRFERNPLTGETPILHLKLFNPIDDWHGLSPMEAAAYSIAFFYASDSDRIAQTRTAITDGAHAAPWIYRAKDVRNFWSRAHYNRPGGTRDASPTAGIAESKPIWFTELGRPAIDKGGNAPNLFVDAKSSESAIPPFLSGARDDLIQRRALEAYLRH